MVVDADLGRYRERDRKTKHDGLAPPFFHIPAEETSEHTTGRSTDNGLDEWDAYHLLMMAYPGYTVGIIQEELSWRQLDLLFAKWEKKPPGSVRIERIEKMISKQTGITFEKKTSGNLLDQLKGLGWI